jgi:hypothetical protein
MDNFLDLIYLNLRHKNAIKKVSNLFKIIYSSTLTKDMPILP